MKKTRDSILGLVGAAFLLTLGCGTAGAGGLVDTSPGAFDDADFTTNFSADITNSWWSLTANTNYLYFAEADGECEWNLMEIEGSYLHDFDAPYENIQTRIILDRAWVDGECDFPGTVAGFAAFMATDPPAAESTYDWYAQDFEKNIWYMGEDTYNGDDKEGPFVAEAGIVVTGVPAKGDFYQQEFYEGEAEDWGKVLNFILLDEDVCMKTKEWAPLGPGHVEHKYYCTDDFTGEGELTLIRELKGKTVVVDLIATNVTPPTQAVVVEIDPLPHCP